MKKKYQHFLFRLTILSVVILLLLLVTGRIMHWPFITPALYYIVILLYLITALVHFILLKTIILNPKKFVGYFMLATTVKLLAYLIVLVAFVFTMKEGVLGFVLAFFILYIIFTVFEVVSILSQSKE